MATSKPKSTSSKSRPATEDISVEDFFDKKARWYIVQTYVGFEEAVKRSLELKMENVNNLKEKILEIYIPNRKVMKLNAKGERQEKIERVYPGYIYIRMVLDKEVGYIIQNTNYVSRIAGTGNAAVPLDEGYVEKLKESLTKENETSQKTTVTNFKLGDIVTVIEGPFKDMTGKVSGIDNHNSTIDVLLTMFERDTVVNLDVLAVRKEL